MKRIALILLVMCFAVSAFATNAEVRKMVKKASMSYIEGFYEGDTEKLKSCLIPEMNKYGFWKKKGDANYSSAGSMTFEQALAFARNVKEKKDFAKPGSPKKVEVLEVSHKIAITKVTAWWGVDYMMLAKNNGKWMIRQILWEGPVTTSAATEADHKGAKKAGWGYIQGFYEGDASKLKSALMPKMFKYGYGYNRQTGEYRKGGQMTFERAIAYANRVKETKNFAKPDAPKKVEVLDVMNRIAAIKVTAWWGIDYMLLSKNDGKWMIEQVLWSGMPPAPAAK